ncbi:hypothetical protein, partial [Alistipes communis]|uniref:hypothetical protein n=1 Tax=Alistipes communis TaxID=2585118 RepID=UPI003A866CF2
NPLQDSRRFFAAGRPAGAIGGRFVPPRRRLIPQFCRLGRPAVRIVRLRAIFAIGMFRRPDSVPVGTMYNFNYLRR